MREVQRPWVVISLTEPGKMLAQRIVARFPTRIHVAHKPKPFAQKLQAWFGEGSGLICICASGIVVRTLAPVLSDKFCDPPVLVLDERGQTVIPLLSGHEGQANHWASRLAAQIDARCICTTAENYSAIEYVAGMGCVRGCSIQVLRDLLFDNMQRLALDRQKLRAITSISVKSDEVGLLALAKELAVPFVVYDAAQLRQVEDRLSSRSETVFAEVACYGVAEGAALYHVDIISEYPARLLMHKIKNRHATLAFVEIEQGNIPKALFVDGH